MTHTDFTGQVALVTGGSRGIGRAIVLALAQLGCQVYFCYQSNQVAAEVVCQEAHAQGWSVTAVQADVTDRRAVDQLIATILTARGRLDILVNNAGKFPQHAVIEISDEEWDEVVRTNLYSVFYCARAVLPNMLAAKAGVIINIVSVAGQRGSAYHAHYAAAKAGVIAFTRSLAKEVAAQGIRVNAVAPGRIQTELLLNHADEREYTRWMNDTPAKRLGTPEEVADAVLFLASLASSYIIGETLAVNGGLLMD